MSGECDVCGGRGCVERNHCAWYDHMRSLESRVDVLSEEMWRALRERDEARREYCALLSDLYRGEGEPPHPREVADAKGWDCFRENTNG